MSSPAQPAQADFFALEEHGRALERIDELERRLALLLKSLGDPGECRACGAVIWWVTTKSGKKAPITTAGLNHFADCPNAAAFKRDKNKHDQHTAAQP